MDKSHGYAKGRALALVLVAMACMGLAARQAGVVRAQSNPAGSLSDSDLITQFRRVEVASVSDALEQVTGKKM